MKPTPIQASVIYEGTDGTPVPTTITPQRSRLKGVFYLPSNIAGATRIVELKDNSSGDVLFSFWVFQTDPASSSLYPSDTVYLEATSNGILFPGGIELVKSDYFTKLFILYQA